MTTATLHIPDRDLTIELSPGLESALLSAIDAYTESLFDQSLQTPAIQAKLSRLSHSLDVALGK